MSVEAKKTIRQIFGFNKTEGDVGIEIECEANAGPYFPGDNLPIPWVATHDGSLRGISVEYVMSQPVNINKVGSCVMDLQKTIALKGTNIKYSFRAGTHIHVNCQELTPTQVILFACLYYSLENVLVDWCGDDRVGNLFCLRVRDAEGVLPYVGRAFKEGKLARLADNSIRYASLNYCALAKYGSLEFRAMATEPDFSRIVLWAEMLLHLREVSLQFDSIQTMLERFSMTSPEQWCEDILGGFYPQVKDQKDIGPKVWEGVRYAQDFLFYTI